MTIEEFSKPLQVGSTVKLKEGTFNLRKGMQVEVVGFLDDDPTRIVVKGSRPGGWVDSKKVIRDNTPVRSMTFLEMVVNSKEPTTAFTSFSTYMRHYYIAGAALNPAQMRGAHKMPFGKDESYYVLYHADEGTVNISLDHLLPKDTPILEGDDWSVKIDPENIKWVYYGGHQGEYPIYTKFIKETVSKIVYTGSVAVNERLVSHIIRPFSFNKSLTVNGKTVKLTFTVPSDYFSIYKGQDCIFQMNHPELLVTVKT